MADISLIQDDTLDDSDEVLGVYEEEDGPSGDLLSPLAQFQKYALSVNVFDRRMVPGILKDLFKNGPAEALAKDLSDIMNLVTKLADQDESMVRIYIFEHVPILALAALDCAEQVPELNNIFSEYLLPLIVRNLGDNDNQVRKAAQSTLFVLIENGLVTRKQAELQVCPNVLEFWNMESVMENHTSTITLMSKLAPFLGSEITERMFLVRFTELCHNDLFHIRKVCASHFGDFCAVIGKEAYEQTLLPCYLSLCNDEVWGVRKACAEVATSVSCPCSSEKRCSALAPVFTKLLQDQSRWVRISAFQTLGPFISTFADPSITSLAYNSLGELVVVNNDGTEFRFNSSCQEGTLSSVFYQFQERFNLMEDEQDNFLPKNDMYIINDISDSHEIKIDNVALELIVGKEEVENDSLSLVESTLHSDVSEHISDNLSKNSNGSALRMDPTTTENNDNMYTDLFINPLNIDRNIDTGLNRDFFNGSGSVKDIMLSETIVLDTDSATSSNGTGLNDIATVNCDNLNKFSNGSTSMLNRGSFNNDHCYVIIDNGNDCIGAENCEAVENQYSSFNYWHINPELPLDELIVDRHIKSSKTSEETMHEQHFILMKHCGDPISTNMANGSNTQKSSNAASSETLHSLKQCNSKLESTEPLQYIVPQLLIDHYISMADQNLADSTDRDLAYHCAYSLPAVVLTLGRSNWHILKNTAEALAGNIHYKVRRTVASSLHELAIILGSEMATSNLTPIFDEFIKDLDEVRIGILKHLAHFLGLITQSKRNLYLPKLVEFLPAKNMNRSNWRFRKELAEQLLDAMNLFRPSDVTKYISYIAQELLCDKVAAVRESALLLVTELVRYISNERKLTSHLLVKLAEKFAHSTNWKRRQTFSLLCAKLLMSNVLDLEQFASDVMPHLLDLSWDPVPNVRLVVGRTISQQIASNGFFFDAHSQHYDSIHSVLRRLQSDKDCDVRQSAVISKLTTVY